MAAKCGDETVLRAKLRAATQDKHQRLDNALGQLDLADRGDYTRFLHIQASARVGVERWLLHHAPSEWVPPSQMTELRRDLDWLGASMDDDRAPEFTMPSLSSEAWIGAAWVLAGSSLGNAMMERNLTARVPASWPMAFLRDRAMPQYFKALRPQLQVSRPNLPAEWAARAVFAHFQAEVDRQLQEAPA